MILCDTKAQTNFENDDIFLAISSDITYEVSLLVLGF